MEYYWLIENDNTKKNPFVSELGNIPDFLGSYGKPLNFKKELWIGSSSAYFDGDPDDLLQTNLVDHLIISNELRISLENIEVQDFQYVPIKVLNHKKQSIGKFFIANILSIGGSLDRNKSDFDVFPDDYFLPHMRGTIRGIRKACLKKDTLSDYDIFRLASFPSMIFVSDRFKRVFEKNSFTGATFLQTKCS